VKKILVAFFVMAGLLGTTATANAVVDIDGRYWLSTLGSNVKISSASVVGTNIDFVDDLGFDKTKGFLEGRITLSFGKHRLRYGFVPLKWSGSKTLAQSVTFNGKTYTASTKVDSDLDLTYHRLGYEYDFIDMLSNRLGVIFEIKYFDVSAGLRAPALGLDESESLKAPVPTVGIAAQVGLPLLFNVGGEATGVAIGSKAYLFDGEVAVNFKPLPLVVISGGYRVFKLHLEDNNDEADFKLKGPFLQVRADF